MKTFFDILYNYIFVIELGFAIGIITFRQKRRSNFVLRLIACLLVVLGASSIWTTEASTTLNVALVILRYVVLFALAVASVYVLFDGSPLSAIFYGTCAYALQHFAYRIGEFAAKLVVANTELAPMWLSLIAESVKIVMVALIYILYALLFASRLNRTESALRKNKMVVLINFFTIIIVTCLSTIFNRFGKNSGEVIWFVCSLYAICGSFVILFSLHVIARNDDLKTENETLERMLQLKSQQYVFSKETIEAINIKCHDMKHKIYRLKDKIATEEINELEQSINIYDLSLATGNNALDIVLTEKGLVCQPQNIRFTCIADGKLLAFMSDVDIYSLFGNAIDNAIAAVKDLPADKRVIDISVKRAMDMCSIHFENWYDGQLLFDENNLPVTTNDDKLNHGFGLKSVKRTVEKYNGYMKISAEDGVFKLNMSFPLK